VTEIETPLLRFDDVVVGAKDHRFGPVTLDLADDRLTAVVGPSGGGKSTLLRLAVRLVVPDQGRVLHRGRDIAGQDARAMRRSFQLVLQKATLFASSVIDNLVVADPDLDEAGGIALLDQVGLPPSFLTRDVASLSGGEGHRVALARGLAVRPDALLLDEPTAGLDERSAHDVLHLLQRLAGDGTPTVVVLHDLDLAVEHADDVVVMAGGRVVAHESASRLSTQALAPFFGHGPSTEEPPDDR